MAPTGCVGGLTIEEVAARIGAGVRRAVPDLTITLAPLADGGEGFAAGLVAMTGGNVRRLRVTGPAGAPVEARYGFLGRPHRRTAVMGMAGPGTGGHAPGGQPDPMATTTRGLGELVAAALDSGARSLLVGCGDAVANDGGAGMAQALGYRLLDRHGASVEAGGAALIGLAHIDPDAADRRLRGVRMDVACDLRDSLLGEHGVARALGPRAGAALAEAARLEAGLENLADVARRDLGVDVRDLPGAGASGGLGGGLAAFCGARLRPRREVMSRIVDIDGLVGRSDLVITMEVGAGASRDPGTIAGHLAERARIHGVPLIVIAASRSETATGDPATPAPFTATVHGAGGPIGPGAGISRLLTDCAERTMRAVAVGLRMGARERGAAPGAGETPVPWARG